MTTNRCTLVWNDFGVGGNSNASVKVAVMLSGKEEDVVQLAQAFRDSFGPNAETMGVKLFRVVEVEDQEVVL